jgi:UDP-glucose 4-epimerase
MPFVAQVAAGLRPVLQVFGNDYDTHDGTGVRDYIHVMDLAQGHLAALHHLGHQTGWQAYNLGSGQGYSVLDMVKAFEQACGHPLPFKIVARRSGDVARCFAKVDKAHQLLSWQVERGLAQMCLDAWRWQQIAS